MYMEYIPGISQLIRYFEDTKRVIRIRKNIERHEHYKNRG
jgi:hypothetical protein